MSGKKKSVPNQTPPSETGKWNDTRKAASGVKTVAKQISSDVTQPSSTGHELFLWSTSLMDHEYTGSWSWSLTGEQSHEVLEFLEACEKKTWNELCSEMTGGRSRHKKHHDMDVDELVKEASLRLSQHLSNDDLPDKVFRFRINGTTRLWGIRQGKIFQLIWYDPEHKVYPTERS